MKSCLLWIVVLWVALVIEQTRPDLCASYSLLIPAGVGCLFWFERGTGVVLSGTALTFRWLLLPESPPVEAPVILLASVLLLTRRRSEKNWLPVMSGSTSHRWWLCPFMVAVAGLSSHVIALKLTVDTNGFSDFTARLLITAPTLAAIVFTIRLADDLGLRRRTSPL